MTSRSARKRPLVFTSPKRERTLRVKRHRITGAVTSWNQLQLWIATAVLAIAAWTVYKGLERWEAAHADRVAMHEVLIDDAIANCERTDCNPRTDSTIPKALASQERIQEVEEYAATEAWLRPTVYALAFGVVPLVALLMHWVWYESRRRRRR
jgi:hypothetical protein